MEHVWHHLSVSDVFQKLKSHEKGLTSDEAKERITRFGLNELPKEKLIGPLVLLLRQVKSSLVLILIGAAIISFALHDVLDAYVILAAVVLNVVVGFIQEFRAQRALAALRSVVTFDALVMRDGEEVSIPAVEVVPGDVLVLKTGTRIPADARLTDATSLAVTEAPLTGESFPVPKTTDSQPENTALAERKSMVFMGTTVAQGTGRAVVVATGSETEFGQISELLRATPEDATPLQQRLQSFSRVLGGSIIAIALAMFLVGVFVGKSIAEVFTISIAVAVAAIPEGLLVAVTVILAIGMQRILKQRALVRQMVAAETLGSTTVICTDKTGTLTEGNMSVVRIVTEGSAVGFSQHEDLLSESTENATPRYALTIGLLSNDAHVENEDATLEHRVVTGNPTERALVYAAHSLGMTRHALEKEYPRIDTIPFDSERKYMATLHAAKGSRLMIVKGAPERILAMCTYFDREGESKKLTQKRRDELKAESERMSSEGLRVIAIAHRKLSGNKYANTPLADLLTNVSFVGLIGMKDPLRPGARQTIEECLRAGIRTVMITGDHKKTAQAIAAEIGLLAGDKNVMSGEELAAISDYDFEQRIEEISVYARVTPKDKLRIIDAWQARGNVVAMTGDGINDAPALKSANIGVALGSGTDVAKEAADVVLLDDNFKTIVAAVRQGRVIFENIQKVVLYLLTDSFSEVVVVAMALATSIFIEDFPIPLLAAQILWINLVTDGLPNIALTVEPEEGSLMEEPPRKTSSPLLTLEMKWLIGVVSVVSAVAAFIAFMMFWKSTGNIDLARTVAFTILGVDSLLYVFSVRSFRHSLFRTNPFTNKFLVWAVLLGFGIQLAALYFPPLQRVLGTTALGWSEWAVVIIGVLIVESSVEIVKLLFRIRRLRTANP